MKKILTAVFAACLMFGVGYVVTPDQAQAWTQEECPTKETHPDCEQYFPSPTPEPSVEPSTSPSPDTKDDDQGRGDGPTGPNDDGIKPGFNYGVGVGGASGM